MIKARSVRSDFVACDGKVELWLTAFSVAQRQFGHDEADERAF